MAWVSPDRARDRLKIRYIQIQRGIRLGCGQFRVHGNATGGIEKRSGVAAVNHSNRIVRMLAGRAREPARPASISTNSKSSARAIPGLRPDASMARTCSSLSSPLPTASARVSGLFRFSNRSQPVRG
jgi:hypothetical protein